MPHAAMVSTLARITRMNGVKRRLARVTLWSLTAALFASPALAWSPWSRVDDTARGRLVDVQIEVDGRDVPLYPSPQWDARRYFEASHGREYAVTLHNVTDERVGVLLVVDGLNVITGKRSSLDNNESMYVLDPHGSATIRGWRTSLDDIRHFVFVDEERSYASRTDQANGDLGWVRVLAFRENRPIAWGQTRSLYRDGADNGAPAPLPATPENGARREDAPRAAQKSSQGLDGFQNDKDEAQSNPGTGWGRAGYDPVREVQFIAQLQPLDRIVLRYEYADGLRALGIRTVGNPDRTWQRDRGELGFAQPPRW